MDILDILIAKKKSFTGETERLVREANAAMQKANEVAGIIDDAQEALTAAQTANENAQAAASHAEEVMENIDEAIEDMNEQVNASIETITAAAEGAKETAENAVSETTVEDNNTSTFKSKNLKVRKKNILNSYNLMKNYTSTGSNEDGSMTQKAITDKLNFGSVNKGKIAIIGDDGFVTYGTIKESEINQGGSVTPTPTPTPSQSSILGVIVDYENKIITRSHDSVGFTPGEDFNTFSMYGGRKRCNVNAAGRITAWYGDEDYADDGSNGDVMIYQPKFYYKRVINKADNGAVGKIIRKETLLISETEQTGFKLHPRFKNSANEILDYILLPAYEGSTYDVSNANFNRNNSADIDFNNDYLVSCAYSQPVTNLTIINAEKLAKNKGANWHINDMGVESINQMLFIIEYGTMNGQEAIGAGISKASSPMNTGLTAILGNETGELPVGSNIGYKAISYRGYENWWGNTWSFIGGIGIKGDDISKIGIPYIATDFNYDPENLNGYTSLGFNIATVSSWISAMGYGNEEYDWIYLPAECEGANSAVPIGDNFWTMTRFDVNTMIGSGGSYAFDTSDGPFYYGCDRPYDYSSNSYNARLMYIPTKGSTYNSNYQNWLSKMGG